MKRNLLKSKMALYGYTDKDLADRINVTKATVSRKLNGPSKFSVTEIAVIKKWLRLTDKEIVDIFLA